LASVAGCSAEAADARIGTPRAPREATCNLVIVNAMDPATFAAYDQVGIVRVGNASAGTDPLDPSMRELVRPRACALGGEAISVMASGDARARTSFRETAYAAYVVWAKKRASGAASERF
jgi:hypothetical protein